MNYIDEFDSRIGKLFRRALKISLKNRLLAWFFLKTSVWQHRAMFLRRRWEGKGIHVPPVMIISITHRCNLRCKGCYARAFGHSDGGEISRECFCDIIEQASRLGISIIMLAGGEPLLRKDIMTAIKAWKHILFPFFTNGILIDKEWMDLFHHCKNLIPVISLEGERQHTDERRGEGIYDMFLETAAKLKKQAFFWGVSFTVTSLNYPVIVNKIFLKQLIEAGCRLFFFVEYVPVAPGTESLTISVEQRKELLRSLAMFRNEFPGLFISFPGDEEAFGGCLAAGRGFVHVNPKGRLEPCPFAPYSDADLNGQSLKEALSSNLMKAIRENHHKLTETSGGCALWKEREWVQSLL
jgi:MoaA/NifB/PqqE/SkfB family radical SAM enzyme